MSSTPNALFDDEPRTVQVTRVDLGPATAALLVRPAVPRRCAPGILWLHWLGHNRGNMFQFLPEAVDLAREGVVSLLPQGSFPWHSSPTGDLGDADKVLAQLRAVEIALASLRGVAEVDADNIAIVGHDYGAMYALLLQDPSVKLLVAATPDAHWDTWFRTYWPTCADDLERYAHHLAPLAPLAAAGSYGPRLFLQWADKDEYVGARVPELYARAAPEARVATYAYDHQLGDAAVTERLGILRACLLDGQGAEVD